MNARRRVGMLQKCINAIGQINIRGGTRALRVLRQPGLKRGTEEANDDLLYRVEDKSWHISRAQQREVRS